MSDRTIVAEDMMDEGLSDATSYEATSFESSRLEKVASEVTVEKGDGTR